MKYNLLSQSITDGPICHAASVKSVAENRILMVGSTTGKPLRDGTVFAPGAFKKCAKQFVIDGQLLQGHDWGSMELGVITDAYEKDSEFLVEAEYHDTEAAQAARAIDMKRLGMGKKVSVSIGFQPDWDSAAYFETGKAMVDFLEKNGGTEGYDTAAIKKLDWCRLITTVNECFEISRITVGMNKDARGIEANSLSFNDDFDETLGRLDQFITRWENVADLRPALGESHVAKLGEIVCRLETIAQKAEPARDAANSDSDSDPARTERIIRLMDRAMSVS